MNLDTIKLLSAQAVFDHVASHLLLQMSKSQSCRNNFRECLYRSGDLMCAAGCLISDNEYTFEIEGQDWNQLVAKGYAPKEHMELICDLQDMHDSCDPADWREALTRVAADHGLSPKDLYK